MTEDAVQLRRFVEKGDEQAFSEMVCRHFDLVYRTALRRTNGDAGLSEDVAQTVFTDLARKARFMPREIILAGWLHEAARFAAAKAVRSEQRRRLREQEAFSMQDATPEVSPDWERIQPVLDRALAKLNDHDRIAVLLHYFERKSFRAVGGVLGLSEDAAQKRVSRALDKLRAILTRGGVTVSTLSLSSFLNAQAMPSQPARLALSAAKCALAKAAAAGPPGFGAVLVNLLAFAQVKLPLAFLLVLLLGGGVARLIFAHPVEHGEFMTVDLSAHYNGGLDKSWTPAYGNNYLTALGNGRHLLKNVPFEVHGVVQLQGAEWRGRGYQYPESVEGIRVGTIGRRIHLLHANSAFNDLPGTTVAGLVVHYADGQQAEFAIRQGVHLLDWWQYAKAPIKRTTDTNTVVAWIGSNPAAEHQGARIQLFDTAFINPRPEEQIESIDYTSAMAGSAPFMVALTIER